MIETPDAEPITRIAARGDGLTASGRHAPGAAPGDTLLLDGTLIPGPHRAVPPCRHYGQCGGCQLQHIDEASLAQFVRDRVAHAAIAHNLAPEAIAAAHLSPPLSRRRATLHAGRVNGAVAIGFRAEGSHALVPLKECHVLHPALFALVEPLRHALSRNPGRLAIDIELALADQGVDCALKGLTVEGLAATEGWLDFAKAHNLARLSLDQGYGPEALWEPEPLTITLGGTLAGVPVPLPPGAFLQATLDGETALATAAREWLSDSPTIADLFSGLGTFAFALAGATTKVLAVEADRAAHLACKTAAGINRRPVHTLHRDLFRNPLLPDELNRFAAVLLDPPRAGAREQCQRLAQSTVPKIAYISCNPASWARDAATLTAGGYRLTELRPVGQFRWSTHVELASLFIR